MASEAACTDSRAVEYFTSGVSRRMRRSSSDEPASARSTCSAVWKVAAVAARCAACRFASASRTSGWRSAVSPKVLRSRR
ncbi:MAG: hypothetical protein QM765_22050 [Myxococcales bacterium]